MNNSTKLRDYQLSMLQDLYKAWKRNRSVMVQMPTGTGKTHLMAAVIRKYADKGVLVVAHRRELITQISQTLDNFEVEHGLIVSGKEIDFGQKVQVASIQTLTRRLGHTESTEISEKKVFHFSLIIVDEAHHALANTYRMLWEKWPNAKFLGLTATPCRLNNAPFTDLFQVLLQSYSIQEFIDKGWLSDFEYVSAAPNSEVIKQVRSLNKRGADGDFQQKELATVMDVPESVEHLYNTYRQFAHGKKGIVYAIDRKHAEHIAEHYRSQGVRCAVIDAKTPAEERKRLIESLTPDPSPKGEGSGCQGGRKENGSTSTVTSNASLSTPLSLGEGSGVRPLDVLVNVDIFSEGFDCPEVEFIQLARPTLSLSKYLQQVGRGMRVSAGKPHVVILDNVGLYQTFGLPTEERDWRRTFHGQDSGRGMTDGSRMVVLDDAGLSDPLQRELVNLQMVRIKKGGKRSIGLEVFLKDGKYGVRNNGRVSCPARFKEIVRLKEVPGYFAAGIYGIVEYGTYREMASLITTKGIDLHLHLYRDVYWQNGIFCSRYQPPIWKDKEEYYRIYWDPKGNCYYREDPEFQKVAGVEIATSWEHDNNEAECYKFRVTTGNQSPRFYKRQLFYNDHIIIARDYLVVKCDKNHAYHICGFWNNTVIVLDDRMTGYLQIGLDGRKVGAMKTLPVNLQRINAISYIYYQKELKMKGIDRSKIGCYEL